MVLCVLLLCVALVTLDVGCGSNPKGDVNVDVFRSGWNRQEADQIRGEFVNPNLIPNFVVASAMFLPFKDGCFDLVISSHTVEHVVNPFLMVSELVRVSGRKVVVKCPHRLGSGAKRPFHLNYFDKSWFVGVGWKLGVKVDYCVSMIEDALISQRLLQLFPFLSRFYTRNLLYRGLRKVERKLFSGFCVPFEVEVHYGKVEVGRVVFVCVSNDLDVVNSCLRSGEGVRGYTVWVKYNLDGVGLSRLFNCFIDYQCGFDGWYVFCHQDFVLNECISSKLVGLSRLGVYGVIGSRLGNVGMRGQIRQTDGPFRRVLMVVVVYHCWFGWMVWCDIFYHCDSSIAWYCCFSSMLRVCWLGNGWLQ